MTYKCEMYIPDLFFCSARKENDMESLSERIAKALLGNFLKVTQENIIRGNENAGEPDYLIDSQGFEGTTALTEDRICQLRGVKTLSDSESNVEEQLISVIQKAINKKKKKKYSVKTSLIVFCLDPLPDWETVAEEDKTSIYNENNDTVTFFIKPYVSRKDTFFQSLYYDVIDNGLFQTVIIINLTLDKKIICYDIKQTVERTTMGKTIFEVKNDKMIPLCHIVEIIDDNNSKPKYLYSVKIAKIESV